MSDIKKLEMILRKIKEILKFLPTNQEKLTIIDSLKEIISFLEGLKGIFANMPSIEEAEKAKNALLNLENILQKNPLIKEIVIGKPIRLKKEVSFVKPQTKIEISDEIVEEELERLKKLSENEIRNLLNNDKKYAKKLLIAISEKLGRKVSSKMTKKELIENIVTTIINKRTYEGLMKLEK